MHLLVKSNRQKQRFCHPKMADLKAWSHGVRKANYIDRLLCRNSDIHERETRYSSMNLMCPRFTRKTEGGRTFTVRSSIEWNSIDIDIRKKNSVASFKYNLYKLYLDEQKATMIMSL